MRKNEIPIYIIEEHHEAFIVWNKAINEGYLPSKGNVLFHFDEHSDMSTPQFNSNIDELNNDLSKISRFTYEELSIASFIIPAIYLGIINELYWFKYNSEIRNRNCYVRSYNNDGLRLLSGESKHLESFKTNNNLKLFKFYRRSSSSVPIKNKVILDIDLDYFSCTGNPIVNDCFSIEITKEEYQNFKNNKYHRIRYCGILKITAYEKSDRYYYLINYFQNIYPCKLKQSREVIKERITNFLNELHKVSPLIITICRSRFSGYTPSDQWEMIEKELLLGLKGLYNLKFKSL